MTELSEYTNGLPNICGSENLIHTTVERGKKKDLYRSSGKVDFNNTRAACAVALHMHQPLTPAGGDDLRTADVISNLQYMMEHPDIGDNHNASVFRWCYKRLGEIIPQLVSEGKNPRVMLEYSGTLFHGMRKMGLDDVFDDLKRITCDPELRHTTEWLGMPWGHAVAPSTPYLDFRHHVTAWQQHFAGIFGLDALERVRGFSPSEMALPNHPDVAYEFVKTLKDCGYQWVLVQEHTVEHPEDGRSPRNPHIPHRLVATNSKGETVEIIAIVKTQGSDTKLVAQMQPWFEAQSLSKHELAGKAIPPLVTQIADGENGGVMMNEFPPKYIEVVQQSSWSDVPLMNASEYLEHLFAIGIKESDFPVVQPLFQKRIWDQMSPGDGPEKLKKVIEGIGNDNNFHMDGGSWTNDLSWVKGYDNVTGPMEKVSSLFHEKITKPGVPSDDPRFQNALFYLLMSQTSCYRYWGQGMWTDYGRELCRRAEEILENDL